jgi:catechol 2,3-dioxygenase-like lactoylglutathione lyase family enzyme
MITGVNHITLSVKDLEESFDFYTGVLKLRPIARWFEGAYLLAGDMWIVLILDKNFPKQSSAEYSHIAFTVSEENFDKFSSVIIRSGAKIWQENATEGKSLYFLDPNDHKLEIHASDLDNRIKHDRENPWDGLEFFS